MIFKKIWTKAPIDLSCSWITNFNKGKQKLLKKKRITRAKNRKLDTFFKVLFGCPTTNFEPLSRGQPHSPNVNYCVYTILTQRSLGTTNVWYGQTYYIIVVCFSQTTKGYNFIT